MYPSSIKKILPLHRVAADLALSNALAFLVTHSGLLILKIGKAALWIGEWKTPEIPGPTDCLGDHKTTGWTKWHLAH